jgi:cell division protein ZapA
MPDLNIEICGYPTAVSCAPGEEAHIHHLVTVIQRHADSAAQIVGPDRMRQLLFAALFLAEEATTASTAASAGPAEGGDDGAALAPLAARLSAVAERLSRVAAAIQRTDA